MHHFLCIQHFGLAAELCFEFFIIQPGVPCHHNQNRAVIRQLKRECFADLTGADTMNFCCLSDSGSRLCGLNNRNIRGMRAEPGTNRFDTHSGLRFIIMCFLCVCTNSSP